VDKYKRITNKSVPHLFRTLEISKQEKKTKQAPNDFGREMQNLWNVSTTVIQVGALVCYTSKA